MAIPSRSQWLRWGYVDPDRAETAALALTKIDPGLAGLAAETAAAAPDPDLGLAALADLSQVWDLTRTPPNDPGWPRLIRLLGGSAGLGRWLRRRPDDADVCFDDVGQWSKARIRDDIMTRIGSAGRNSSDGGVDELRWGYRRHLIRIAARDLSSADPGSELETTCRELSDLADVVVEAGLAIAEADVADHELVRFAVVGLGKTGAREANYVSDVDVLYVVEPRSRDGEPSCSTQEAIRVGAQIATRLANICSEHTAAGAIWELDPTLRPEGAAGPLVRSLSSMRGYYHNWAENWEFQAMMKARGLAGDEDLGADFVALVSPLVWTAAERADFVAEAQAMRAKVVETIPPSEADRDIKLGSGGLRDTEFSVQLLQLVHGRSDQRLREPATLAGLAALIEHGYVGRADGAELDRAYRFQRLLEHRLQLYHLRRTHLMPSDETQLRRLARCVGLKDATAVWTAWRSAARTVQRLHERIYYSPLLEAVARIPSDAIHLSQDAALARLKALGYADPGAALGHIEALTAGLTRRAEISRQLLPALLGWIAAGVNPDAGLLAFRQVADALGSTPFFLRALRDEGQLAQDLARVLSSSRYAASLLQHSPASVEIIFQPAGATTAKPDLTTEFSEILARHEDDARTGEVIRATRRRELLRIAMSDVLGQADIATVAAELSELNGATIAAALEAARRQVDDPPRMAVIALGRWGGREMAYCSDADLMVIVQDSDDPDVVRRAGQILRTMRQTLKVGGADPDLEIDLRLRPEGGHGPLVRTLSSTRAYYAKWSQIWEAQALIRARHGGGDIGLSEQFLDAIETIRYPDQGATPAQLNEIRRLKARMESERIGRGADAKDHLKLGPGSLSDVEWTVQCLQLRQAWRFPELRVTGTLEALDAASQAGLIEPIDAQALRESFLLASRIRNAATLLRNKPCDVLAANAADLGEIAQILGYPRAHGSHLHDEWLRLARRARAVTDRLFWGL